MKYKPFALLLLLTSCIEHFDAQLPDSQTQLLVVEGTIIGNQVCPFYLSHTFSLNDDDEYLASHYISNATLSVQGSDGSSYPGQLTAPGCYEVTVGQLSSDVSYSLLISVDGQQYSSEPRHPLVTPAIDSLSFAQPREDLLVDIMVTPAASSDPTQTQYYCWTYDEWWEIRTPLHAVWQYIPELDSLIYLDPKTDRGFRHVPGRDKIFGSSADYRDGHIRNLRLYDRDHCADCFEYLYYTRVTQMAISLEEYEYLRLNAQQNEEMGGLFTPQPSQLPSNVHCTTDPSFQAIGFVGVCANTTQNEIYIDHRDVGYVSPYLMTTTQFENLGYETYLEAYKAGYRPLTVDLFSSIWVRHFLIDCTIAPWHCTLTPPDFWPNK